MTVRVAINGFGRIGRKRPAGHRRVRPHGYRLVGINDLGPVEDQRALASASIQVIGRSRAR